LFSEEDGLNEEEFKIEEEDIEEEW